MLAATITVLYFTLLAVAWFSLNAKIKVIRKLNKEIYELNGDVDFFVQKYFEYSNKFYKINKILSNLKTKANVKKVKNK